MKAKTPSIIVALFWVLGIVTFLGVYKGAIELGLWREGFKDSPLRALTTAVVFAIIPLLAIFDISKRHLTGWYLSFVPLLVGFGFALRLNTQLFSVATSPNDLASGVYARMVSVGFLIALGLFIIKLGFSKTVAAYFDTKA